MASAEKLKALWRSFVDLTEEANTYVSGMQLTSPSKENVKQRMGSFKLKSQNLMNELFKYKELLGNEKFQADLRMSAVAVAALLKEVKDHKGRKFGAYFKSDTVEKLVKEILALWKPIAAKLPGVEMDPAANVTVVQNGPSFVETKASTGPAVDIASLDLDS